MPDNVISLFHSKELTEVTEELAWDALVPLMLEPQAYASKDDLPLLKFATFNGPRSNRTVTSITGIECDYDDEIAAFALAYAKMKALGITCLIHTTASHHDEAPRFRILCPFSQPIYRTQCDLTQARITAIQWLEERLGFKFSSESRVLSQSSFYGCVHPETYHAEVVEGVRIDTLVDLKAVPADIEPSLIDYIPSPDAILYNQCVDLREYLLERGYEEVPDSDRLVGPLSESRKPGVTIYPSEPGRPWEKATSFHSIDPLHYEVNGKSVNTMDAMTMLCYWDCGGDWTEAYKRASVYVDGNDIAPDIEEGDEPVMMGLGGFLDLDLPPIVYRIEPFVPTDCMGLIHAKPGVGKTWMMMDLIVASMLGRSWLGVYEVTTPMGPDERALLIDTEMPENYLQQRWNRFLAPLEPDEQEMIRSRVDLFSTLRYQRLRPEEEPFDLALPKWQKMLKVHCGKRSCTLMITDNKSSSMPSEEEENSNDGISKKVTSWLGVMRNDGVSTWLVGHSGHTGENLRGGSAWGGPMDTIIHLNQQGSSEGRVNFELKFKKARHGMPFIPNPKVSLLDVAPGQVALVANTEGDETLSTTPMQMLTKVNVDPSISQRALAEAIGVSQPAIKQHKAALIEKGLLEAGRYWTVTQAGKDLISGGDIDLDDI